MNIAGNFHTHTTFCDGNNTAEEMVREALTLRFDTLGFTGHVDPPQGVAMDVSAYLAEIRRLQEAYRGQIDILRGAELDNVLSPDCAGDTEYRIGSTHFVPDRDMPRGITRCPARKRRRNRRGSSVSITA